MSEEDEDKLRDQQYLEDLADRIEQHNRWRRGQAGSRETYNTKQLGEDLDMLIKAIRRQADIIAHRGQGFMCPECGEFIPTGWVHGCL